MTNLIYQGKINRQFSKCVKNPGRKVNNIVPGGVLKLPEW